MKMLSQPLRANTLLVANGGTRRQEGRLTMLPDPKQSKIEVSRRTALAGLGAGGLGFALAAHGAAAQDATPFPMAGHPLVGSWIVDRNPDDPTEITTYNDITSDGTISDPSVGGAGVWAATGPNSATFTLTGTIADLGAYFLVRASVIVDDGGDSGTATYSSTIVAADGTVMDDLTTSGNSATYLRIRLEPVDATGPLPKFPAWTPAPPAAATPTS
jgi:hypothetical protein